MNYKTLEAINHWINESKSRSADIKLGPINTIWVYDTSSMYGKFIEKPKDLPTDDDIKKARKESLEATLRELENN